MFTGVDLNAYDSLPFAGFSDRWIDTFVRGGGQPVSPSSGSDAGRPGLLVRWHLDDPPPRLGCGAGRSRAASTWCRSSRRRCRPCAFSTSSATDGTWPFREPEPAREARRRRARRRAAEGEEARPVDRALEPGQRGGCRLGGAGSAIAICASASETSVRSRRRTFGASTTSSGYGVTRRPPPRPCGRLTRSAGGESAGRNGGSAPPRRRAPRSPASGTSSAAQPRTYTDGWFWPRSAPGA